MGNRYKCVIPLDSAIVTAYNNAKNLGLFQNVSLDDLVLRGMNFGWEIPGTFDAQMTLYDIGLYFDLKETA